MQNRVTQKIVVHLFDILFFVGLSAMTAVLIRVKNILVYRRLPGLIYKLFLKRWVGLRLRLTYAPENAPYEHEVLPFCTVEDGKCFVDVGANAGVYTTRLASQGVPVHAFEPSQDIYALLCENVKHFGNVTVYPYALSDKNCEVEFYLLSDDYVPNRFLTKVPEHGPAPIKCPIRVEARTLDSFKIENVGLIKVDVEGHEYEVLRGAMQTLTEQKPTLIVEIHPPIWKNDIRVMSVLHEADYGEVKRIWRKHHRKYFIVAND